MWLEFAVTLQSGVQSMWRQIAVSTCLLFIATSAEAQVTRVTGAAGSVITFPISSTPPSGRNSVQGAGILTNTSGSGASYDSFVSITPSAVSFESGNAVSGPSVRAKSSSSVDIVFTNDIDAVVTPVLHSTIIPAGMGFYLADLSSGCGGNVYTGCPQSLSGLTFSDLSTGGDGGATPLAFAGFDFSIVSEGVTLYQLKASMNLTYDPTNGVIVTTAVANAASRLNGFTQVTPLGSQSAMGFAWGATDFAIPLASLGIGQSQKLTYLTSVETFSRASCINSTTCLVAYSGFGDPIGRGGGQSFRPVNASAASSGVSGVNFTPAGFNLPSYSKGVLTYRPGRASGAIPEPSTWALMLVGFGMLGAAVRGRRPSLTLI